MNINKCLLLLFFSFFVSTVFGQYGTTSAGTNDINTSEITMAYTIGEVINLNNVNEDSSTKMGILQPLVKIISSTAELIHSNINVFPNPAVDLLNIELEQEGIYNYKIFNTVGQSILSGTVDNRKILISELENGSYHIVLSNGTSSYTKQFQKFNVQ